MVILSGVPSRGQARAVNSFIPEPNSDTMYKFRIE